MTNRSSTAMMRLIMTNRDSNMKILCITHADFESPGIVESWAREAGYSFQIVRPYKGEKLNSDFDMLVVMGGPQSATKLDDFPYLADEVVLIKTAIADRKRVLGFCLGAQLIGQALNAPAARSPEKEVGVYPIHLTEEGLKDPLLAGLPQQIPVIHWHNDMPGMNEESILLAYSEGCPRQIIRYKPLVYGLQCHLEIDLDGIKTMIEAVPEDLAPSKYTQTKDELLAQDYTSINGVMVELLNRLVSLEK